MADCKFSPAISMMDIGSKDVVDNVDYSEYYNYRADLAPKTYREIADHKKSYNNYLNQVLKPPNLHADGRVRDGQYNSQV